LEQRSPCRYRNERSRGRRARPRGGHPLQFPPILVVDPILTPGTPPIDQLELAAAQRVERVGHANERRLISLIACSRLLSPNPAWSAASGSTSARSSTVAPFATARTSTCNSPTGSTGSSTIAGDTAPPRSSASPRNNRTCCRCQGTRTTRRALLIASAASMASSIGRAIGMRCPTITSPTSCRCGSHSASCSCTPPIFAA
jgi:hypothetical protein